MITASIICVILTIIDLYYETKLLMENYLFVYYNQSHSFIEKAQKTYFFFGNIFDAEWLTIGYFSRII